MGLRSASLPASSTRRHPSGRTIKEAKAALAFRSLRAALIPHHHSCHHAGYGNRFLLLRAAARNFDGRIVLGRDLMEL